MYEGRLELTADAVVFLFLPLAHVLARVTQLVALDVGGTLAYWSGDAGGAPRRHRRVASDALPVRPARVREDPHAGAGGRGGRRRGQAPRSSTGRSPRAAGCARPRRPAAARGGSCGAEHALADRLVLSKVRALFGDRLQLALTGAAPIARDVLEFFDACGVLILEGYGLTETLRGRDAQHARRLPLRHRRARAARHGGRDRARRRDPAARAQRVPRLPPATRRRPPRRSTAAGCSRATWARSTPDGFLRITGRKKDLIITSSGKNVTPANIEAALRESRWISQAVVVGDNRPYLVALLTLDPDEAPALAERLGLAPDLAAHGARPARARAARGGRRAGQPALRAHRADQALRHPRPRPHPGRRRADADAEGQAGIVTERFADEIRALYA